MLNRHDNLVFNNLTTNETVVANDWNDIRLLNNLIGYDDVFQYDELKKHSIETLEVYLKDKLARMNILSKYIKNNNKIFGTLPKGTNLKVCQSEDDYGNKTWKDIVTQKPITIMINNDYLEDVVEDKFNTPFFENLYNVPCINIENKTEILVNFILDLEITQDEEI